MCSRNVQRFCEKANGGVVEWPNTAVLKTVRPERVSWVRIPPPPPTSLGISLCSCHSVGNCYFPA